MSQQPEQEDEPFLTRLRGAYDDDEPPTRRERGYGGGVLRRAGQVGSRFTHTTTRIPNIRNILQRRRDIAEAQMSGMGGGIIRDRGLDQPFSSDLINVQRIPQTARNDPFDDPEITSQPPRVQVEDDDTIQTKIIADPLIPNMRIQPEIKSSNYDELYRSRVPYNDYIHDLNQNNDAVERKVRDISENRPSFIEPLPVRYDRPPSENLLRELEAVSRNVGQNPEIQASSPMFDNYAQDIDEKHIDNNIDEGVYNPPNTGNRNINVLERDVDGYHQGPHGNIVPQSIRRMIDESVQDADIIDGEVEAKDDFARPIPGVNTNYGGSGGDPPGGDPRGGRGGRGRGRGRGFSRAMAKSSRYVPPPSMSPLDLLKQKLGYGELKQLRENSNSLAMLPPEHYGNQINLVRESRRTGIKNVNLLNPS